MRVFLDANVLFSAAYHEQAGLVRLWGFSELALVTSTYAIDEARRNLKRETQQLRLARLVGNVEIMTTSDVVTPPVNMEEVEMLPIKDRPILLAALEAKCETLVTGDQAHFGPWFDQRLAGILILRPAVLLSRIGG